MHPGILVQAKEFDYLLLRVFGGTLGSVVIPNTYASLSMLDAGPCMQVPDYTFLGARAPLGIARGKKTLRKKF